MHIVHVTHRAWPVIGGSERYVHEIARRQVRDGYRVTILATDALEMRAVWDRGGRHVDPQATNELAGVRIERLPLRHLPGGSLTFPMLRRLEYLVSHLSARSAEPLGRLSPWAPTLPAALAGQQADLLFGWNITLEGLSRSVAHEADRRHIPWLAVPLLHLARPRFHTMPHQVALLKRADRVLVQTETERHDLLARGFASEQVHIISPGVDLEQADTAHGERFRRGHGIEEGMPMVLALAPLCHDKGIPHLLAAARRLWAKGMRFTLALVGPQPDGASSSVRRAVARLPAWQHALCCMSGEVSEQEKWDALDAADVVALPSRTESFGIVFLEAWACRKPVIGARAGAVPDVIAEGQDGLLVEFGAVVELAHALQVLLKDRALATVMGRRGHEKVARYYQWGQQYARLRLVVDELVG